MTGQKLYKGRYLIALYDKQDYCVGVFVSAKEIQEFLKCSRDRVNKALNRYKSICKNKIYLINCYEKHNDIFNEEDKQFIKFFKKTMPKTVKEISQELGISERQYYRRKQALKGIEKQNENKTI